MGRFYFNECLQRTANMAEKTIVKTFQASFPPRTLSEMRNFNEEIEHVKME